MFFRGSLETKLTEEAIEERRRDGLPTERPYGIIKASEMAKTPRQIAFDALHGACDPHRNADSYSIAVERAATLEAWCGWVHHLTEKVWMGTDDLGRMIAFWFSNRGQSIYRAG